MKGKKVAILESRLGRQLAELLERRGAQAVHAPALTELPDLDPQAIAALVGGFAANPPKLFVFQTGVGTKALFAATDGLGLTATLLSCLQKAVVAVRGPKPAGALRERGVRIDRSAAEPFTTHEILQSFFDLELKDETVIVQRFGSANLELDRALETRGAKVVEIPTYRWSLPADTAPLERLIGALARSEIDAVAFTNGEQARNLFLVSHKLNRSRELREDLNRTVIASIGPVASAALHEAGVRVGLEAKPPKLGALLDALERSLSS